MVDAGQYEPIGHKFNVKSVVPAKQKYPGGQVLHASYPI